MIHEAKDVLERRSGEAPGERVAMVTLHPRKARRSAFTPLGCASAGGLTLLVMLVSGCDGEGPMGGPAPTRGTAPGTVYYFHNDRMGTPLRLTDESGATVWRADYRPFGDVQRLETDVDGDGVHIEQPLRFPGQYDDAMSALILAQGPYYNWNRHFDPGTGRYFSPEPLLQGPRAVLAWASAGRSFPTFAYAFNNPLSFTDPSGLAPPLPNGCDPAYPERIGASSPGVCGKGEVPLCVQPVEKSKYKDRCGLCDEIAKRLFGSDGAACVKAMADICKAKYCLRSTAGDPECPL